jgi:crotonobetainyl-CoA:carnitine CoA-transferase CaiB-like acyl-CoA transferase
MRQLLSDIRVVEIAVNSVAGSYCTKLFADLGADVIKVEPPGGDSLRAGGHHRDTAKASHGGLFFHLNTNKRSVVIDPSSPDGISQLWSLLEGADLLVASEGAGALRHWGVTGDELHQRFSALTVTSATGFGVHGPYSHYKSEDIVAQAVSGVLLFQNRTDQDPLKLPGTTAMYVAGNMAALGSLAGVLRAKATGVGAQIDSAAVEALASTPTRASALLAYQYAGRRAHTQTATDTATLIPMGAFPCADGYVTVVTTVQQLAKLIDLLDDDELRRRFEDPLALTLPGTREAVDAVFYPWLLARTRAEATAAAQALGLPLTGVLSLREVLGADHLHQRGFWVHVDDRSAGSIDVPGPPYRHAEGGWALRRSPPSLGQHDGEILKDHGRSLSSGRATPAVPATKPALPLAGVRVIDMTAAWAGPFVTMLLADLGAEVIRMENPSVFPPSTKGFQPRPSLPPDILTASGYGQLAEGRPDRPYNRQSMNNSISRNKLSCTIDIRRPEGRELFLRLIDISDVFIESFKSTSLDSMGIYPDALEARNPRLVIARVPAVGLNGMWSKWTGFGQNFDALSGLIAHSGHRGSTPTEAPLTMHMDSATGPAAAFAILGALHYRDVVGRSQLVEVCQLENVIQHLGEFYLDLQTGQEHERLGNRHPWRAPQGLYRCGERWLALSVGDDDEWIAMASVMGQPVLARDPRFATRDMRQAHHDELDVIIAEWAARQDVLDAFHRLQGAGIPAGPLLDEEHFSEDPNTVARGWLRPLRTTDVGTHLHPGHPYSGLDQVWRRGSPGLGEDNEYVYKELLGVTDKEFEHYRSIKILSEDYLDKTGEPF